MRLVQDRLLEVTTRLRAHGEDGLAEDLHRAAAKRDHAEAEPRTYRAEAEARRLLYETLRDESDRRACPYVAPLRREFERRTHRVRCRLLGRARSRRRSRSRAGPSIGRTIPYRSLSVGAQEQIAIIGRLACATIVAPDGGVPVILDDALATPTRSGSGRWARSSPQRASRARSIVLDLPARPIRARARGQGRAAVLTRAVPARSAASPTGSELSRPSGALAGPSAEPRASSRIVDAGRIAPCPSRADGGTCRGRPSA